MENASKALLIAGAILISICLISVAVIIINSNFGAVDESKAYMDTAKIDSFNKQFTPYFSDSASASTAKALVNKIIQNNASAGNTTNNFAPEKQQIYLNFYPKNENKITHKWKTSDLKKIYRKISPNKKYNIYTTTCTSFKGGYNNGYYVCLSIKEL